MLSARDLLTMGCLASKPSDGGQRSHQSLPGAQGNSPFRSADFLETCCTELDLASPKLKICLLPLLFSRRVCRVRPGYCIPACTLVFSSAAATLCGSEVQLPIQSAEVLYSLELSSAVQASRRLLLQAKFNILSSGSAILLIRHRAPDQLAAKLYLQEVWSKDTIKA